MTTPFWWTGKIWLDCPLWFGNFVKVGVIHVKSYIWQHVRIQWCLLSYKQYFQSFFRCFTCPKWFHFQQRTSSRIKQTFTGHFDLLRKLYVLNRETNLLSLSKTIHLVYSFPSVSAYICFPIYKQFFPAIRKD